MSLHLIYGNDSVGKSTQLKTIAESSEDVIYISLEVKNRRLLKESECEVVEVLHFTPDFKVDPIPTYETLGNTINRIMSGKGQDGKAKQYKMVVVDGISEIPRYAEKMVIREIQKAHPTQKTIRENNLAGWAMRNTLAYLPFERLSSWAEITGANVLLTTLMADEYKGKDRIGRMADAKDRLKKLCDSRIFLNRDAKGYSARFEKVPGWSTKKDEFVLIQEGGLFVEMMGRGLL